MELEKDGFGRDIIRLKNLFIRELDSLNYSKNTISTYNQQLLVFGDFCEEISDEVGLKDIKQMHISYFFSWLNERIKPKNATKASYYRTLKSFFNFLTKNNDDFIDFDYLFKNFSLKLKKGENKEINFINSTDIDKILLHSGRATAWHPHRTFPRSAGYAHQFSASDIPASPFETESDSLHF